MIRPKIRKLIRTEWKQRNIASSVSHTHYTWKQRSIADSARHTHYTKRLSNCDQTKGVTKMGETTNNESAPKESRYAGLKAEFNKIVWPDKDSVTKQTTAVVIASVILGLIIALIDYIIQYGVDFLVKL